MTVLNRVIRTICSAYVRNPVKRTALPYRRQ